MTNEHQTLEHKSVRYALTRGSDVSALAADCVGFANASGGIIQLGIEDGDGSPPAQQKVELSLAERLRKRIPQLTVNVGVVTSVQTAGNGGEFVEIRVHGNQQSVASTSDGRFFIRVSDETQPVRGDDLTRLMADRSSFVWELQPVRRAPVQRCDPDKLNAFVEQVRASDRVSDFVRRKSDTELLEHYSMARNDTLTHLGVLWVGHRQDRAALLYAPAIQCIKFDDRDRKIRKWVWADFDQNPMEMISAIWDEVPDWRESHELPAGLYRRNLPHYDEVVVRELLANALVHRPYTQQGDVFINLYADRLEIHNPGLLPLGVTPRNILHVSIQRNRHLAKVFYDLKLMEGEGSGFDRVYETLLSTGRRVPDVTEGADRVVVTIQKQIIKPEIVDFVARVDRTFQPTQKELITLGLIAQQEAVTALELQRQLALRHTQDLRSWLGNLRNWGLVSTRGRTKGTEYFVEAKMLRQLEFRGGTTLRGIEKHRLHALILRDLEIYREGAISDIHGRIGPEIARRKVQRALTDLVDDGRIRAEGQRGGRRYHFVPNPPQSPPNGTTIGQSRAADSQ